ncbi:MAG: hypothetical protein KatS3mg076_1144 [Candidatus Binatia bacterium]|nr:MAG: hypothetical protein KatS3mg076_1144 [Candidatus Binatia bacterium]
MIVWAIARNTAREAIRNKVLYSILFFAFLVVGISAVFGAASIGDELKFIKDFSLLSISLFGVVTTVVLGVNLLHKELGKRTILNILSKPVARWQFVLGKYVGLLCTLALLVGLMAAALSGFLGLLEGRVDWGLALASSAILLELAVVLAVAVFFSCIVVTPTLAGLFTAAVFVAGRSAAHLRYFLEDPSGGFEDVVFSGLYAVLPHLHRFWISDQVVYGRAFSPEYFAYLALYASSYAGALLLLGIFFFSRREFV